LGGWKIWEIKTDLIWLIVAILIVLGLGVGYFANVPGTNSSDNSNNMNLSNDSNVQGSDQGSRSSSGNGQNQQTRKKCSVCNGAGKINCGGC